MKKILLLCVLATILSYAHAQCVTNVDFNTWNVGGNPGNGNWVPQGGGTFVHQTVNGNPTFFISPFDMINMHVSGNFRSTDDDDDWMGFVFSFLNPMGATDSFDTWLFDWKQDQQNGASSGKALSRLNGVLPPATYTPQFWDHTNSPEFTVVQNDFGGPGWSQGFNHSFDLYLTYSRATILVDGNPTFDWQDCYKPGRFGFYNLSQQDCYYSNFQYSLFVDFPLPAQACVGGSVPITFVNSCANVSMATYQSITWNFGDGSPITVVNNPTPATVNVSHVYTASGTYTVTLTVLDNNGCSATASHQIVIGAPIVISPTLTPPPCNGGSNGSISLTASGGFGNYTYEWNSGVVGPVLIGVNAGTYTVTATDGYCATSAQFTLTQPPPLTVTTSHVNTPCGVNTGSVSMVISGGSPPYSNINWSGMAGLTVNNLGAGTYVADFLDSHGCSALLQYNGSAYLPYTETIISLPCGINSSTSTTPVSCYGGNNGTATLTVTGGTAPINITWSNGAAGATATGLAAGTYTYTYTDANPAHNFSGTVTIIQPAAAIAAQLTTTGIACAGINNGQAIASVISGGSSPFTYTWSGGQPNNPVVNNLGPGTISVTVTDVAGCTATATGSISPVPSIAMVFSNVIDSCYHAGHGISTVSVSGGSPPYTYLWSNFFTGTSNLNIIGGNYTITVTDNNGCTSSAATTVNGPASPLTRTYVSQNISCSGANDGSFNVVATGGTPGYTYTWNNPLATGNNPTGLAPGNYKFTVTDSWGCTVIGNDTLIESSTPLVATSSHTNITCNGMNNGTITLNVSGGTTPYSFLGNAVPSGTTTIPNLAPNTYAGNLVDSLGCSVALSETITEPPLLTVSETHVNVLCGGAATGSINLTPAGGTPAYSYLWNDASTLQNRSNLTGGSYSVTVTDLNLCSATVSINLTEPVPLTVTETHVDILCNGNNTGSINLSPAGGTPGYTYLWNDANTNQNRTGLTAAAYSVTVTDNGTCTASISVIVTEPPVLTATTSHTDVLCNGANNGTITITVGGGTAPYTFLGNPVPAGTNTITGLAPNTYAGNLTDANGCTVPLSETITEPGPQSVTANGTNNPCFGATQGTASANFVNPTGTVTYDWGGGLTGANISNLVAGTYTVTATDQNGCSLTASYTVTEPAAVALTVTPVDAACFGGNGSATATPNGGNAPFTYLWSNGSTLQTATLPAGTFTVTATDATTCQQTGSATINEPTQVTLQETHTNENCFGDAIGTITITANGGTGGTYTYAWTPNVSTTNSASNLTAGSYDVTAADVNACTATITVVITEPSAINVNASATDATCFGYTDGTVYSNASGGTTPYSFSLTDGTNSWNSATGNFSSLAANSYTVVVTDVNSCTASTNVVVNQPTQIASVVTPVDVSCFGYTDGQIVLVTAGGSPNYTFALSNGTQNTTGSFSNLSPGSYDITVTDANNCTAAETAVINEPPPLAISVTPEPVEVDLGGSYQLQTTINTTASVTYDWQPQIGLSCYDCASPTFSGNYSMVYTVTLISSLGCTGKTTVTVNVVPHYDVFIPNVFTPNGDGANDVWQIFGNTPGIKQLEVKVFNRWGEKVFESTDINFGWDGNYKGTYATPGVYSYVANIVWLNNYSSKRYVGSVTLIK